MYVDVHVKRRCSSYVLIKQGFCNRFSKNTHIPNFMKIRPVGAMLFHVDRRTDGRRGRQTDMTKLMVAFHNFAKASNKVYLSQ